MLVARQSLNISSFLTSHLTLSATDMLKTKGHVNGENQRKAFTKPLKLGNERIPKFKRQMRLKPKLEKLCTSLFSCSAL